MLARGMREPLLAAIEASAVIVGWGLLWGSGVTNIRGDYRTGDEEVSGGWVKVCVAID